MALLLFSILLFLVTAIILHSDLTYFFNSKNPSLLGDASEGLGNLTDNTYVQLSGQGDHRSKFADINGKTYKYFLVLGTPILIEQPAKGVRSTGEISIVKFNGNGRIRKLSNLFKYDMLLDNFKNSIGIDLKENGYILQEGIRPVEMWVQAGLVLLTMALLVYSVIKYAAVVIAGRRTAANHEE